MTDIREDFARIADARRYMDRRCEYMGAMDPDTGTRDCSLETKGCTTCLCDERNEEAAQIATLIRSHPLPSVCGGEVPEVLSDRLRDRHRELLAHLEIKRERGDRLSYDDAMWLMMRAAEFALTAFPPPPVSAREEEPK